MVNRKMYNSKKFLILFIVITLLWTWLCGFLPLVLHITGTPPGTFIFYFGGGAPSVTALFLVFLTYPKKAIADYFRRCLSFKYMGWKYLLWTIGCFTAITLTGLCIGVVFFHLEMPGMNFVHTIREAPYMLFVVLLLSVLSGPLNEEFGWRGYALDKLLLRFGFHGASLILGLFWAIWHLPWYVTPGQAQYNLLQSSVFEAVVFIPSVMLLSIVVSFVYIKTKRSVLAGAMVHLFSNLLNSQMLSPYSVEMGMVIRYVKMGFCMVILVYTAASRQFRRETAEQIGQIKSDETRFTGVQDEQ
jgi:membrane protease YdiL (CAAX protease family)